MSQILALLNYRSKKSYKPKKYSFSCNPKGGFGITEFKKIITEKLPVTDVEGRTTQKEIFHITRTIDPDKRLRISAIVNIVNGFYREYDDGGAFFPCPDDKDCNIEGLYEILADTLVGPLFGEVRFPQLIINKLNREVI